jgi:hypothetical protein
VYKAKGYHQWRPFSDDTVIRLTTPAIFRRTWGNVSDKLFDILADMLVPAAVHPRFPG